MFRPHALWRTRASPGPGSPTGTSSNCRTSGPPQEWNRMAFGTLPPCPAGTRGDLRRGPESGRCHALTSPLEQPDDPGEDDIAHECRDRQGLVRGRRWPEEDEGLDREHDDAQHHGGDPTRRLSLEA